MGIFDLFKSKAHKNNDAEHAMINMAKMVFPGGYNQVELESEQLYSVLNGRLDRAEAKSLLSKTKALIFIAEDNSPERIISSILMKTNGKLTESDAMKVYNFLLKLLDGDLYSGGDEV